jgi:hypothetical protein
VNNVAALTLEIGRHLGQFHHVKRRDIFKPGCELHEIGRQTDSSNEKRHSENG